MPEPTDDELLAVLADLHPHLARCVTPELPSLLRTAVDAETRKDAERFLSMVLDLGGPNENKLARALRSRFPQPITDETLRAEGFEPGGGDFLPDVWILLLSKSRAARWIPEDYAVEVFSGGGRLIEEHIIDEIENVRTPDRLHDVVEHLKGLYAPGEEG